LRYGQDVNERLPSVQELLEHSRRRQGAGAAAAPPPIGINSGKSKIIRALNWTI